MSTANEFTRLLRQHAGILHKVARAYAWSREDRAELLQEMQLQLWRAYPNYRADMPLSTWMYRVALNVAISQLRAATAQRRDMHVTEELPEDHPEPAGEGGPHEEAQARLRTLWTLIQRLPELDRALILMALDGIEAAAIAQALGLSVTNVGTRLQRIKNRLTDDYRKENER
jgi:RNA polymerase sigma-70 factor, ECF subfamily